MSNLLSATRAAVGAAPRMPLSRSLAGARTVGRPSWLRADDGLLPSLHERERLLREGEIVWGWVWQANGVLWKPGNADAPAGVVHGDASFDLVPDRLEEIAQALFALKESPKLDGELADVQAIVCDEMSRPMRRPLPRALSRGRPVEMSTVLVHRRHLPGGFISSSAIPLLVHPSLPLATTLPGAAWAADLLAAWRDLGA